MRLVDLDAVVAEIEKKIYYFKGYSDKQVKNIACNILNMIKRDINTLEVKGADLKRHVYTLNGEIKDAPIADTGDWEVFLDYNRSEYERILDEICDVVNEKYPNDEERYKVTIQITIDKEDGENKAKT